jgi:putative DNA primase/helicase
MSADVQELISDLLGSTTIGPAPTTWAPTDLGNAERFAYHHREGVRFCYAWNTWLIWTGQYWEPDAGNQVLQLAKQTIRRIYQEAAEAATPPAREQLAKWAVASEQASRVRALLDLARAEPGLPVKPDQLDADPFLLNCQNGTLDLRTGTLRQHERADLITKCVPVDYDPAAACPIFEAFLSRIFGERPALIAFVQRAVGYALTGDTREQALFLCWGTGANGKTTLMETMRAMLADYATTAAADTLLARKHDGTTAMNDLSTLQGARLAVAVESDMGRRLAEALVKQLTGGEAIKVKRLYADVYAITPTFKLWIGTNHKPVIRGTDHAIWRRIRLIPFDVTIPDEQQDKNLPDKLKTELPGILRWAVDGCRAWQHGGLGVPDEVRSATADYRADMDILEDFLGECCVVEAEALVAVSDLYSTYLDWAKQSGEIALSKKVLGLHLEERGFAPTRSSSSRRWQGLRLRTSLDDADEPGDAR